MTLFARTLSRTPTYRSQVISITIANAGTLSRIGMPAIWGAVWSRPCTAGSELRSAVR